MALFTYDYFIPTNASVHLDNLQVLEPAKSVQMTHHAPTFPDGTDTYHVNLGPCERTISKRERCAPAHRQAHGGQPRLQDKIVWQDNGDTPVEQCSPKSQQACLVQCLYISNPTVEAKFALVHDCSTILSPFSLLSHLSKYLVFYSCAMSLSKRNHFY